jgi:hypothetical protein
MQERAWHARTLDVRRQLQSKKRSARSPRAGVGAGGRTIATALAALVCLFVFSATAASAQAETATYSAVETIPVPPASDFAGSGGGDGWAVALSETAVYNVFHHHPMLQFACHYQSNAEPCYAPETITDGEGHNFATSGQPGLYLDHHTGKLYVYATRTSDGTAGVVCIDTTLAPTNPDPFCGFTALTPVGHAPLVSGISGASAPMLIGTHLYSFSFANGVNQGSGENELLCFDVSTDAACSGQPYAVSIGTGTVSDGGFPSPATAAIGSKVIIPLNIGGENRLACFDDSTQNSCTGSWPVKLGGVSYASENGAPFPLLDATGKLGGLCLPTGTDQCFNLEGESTTTPAGMTSVIEASTPWNGPALVLGPRVYVPDGNYGGDVGQVECFDYSTGASCANFPKRFSGLGYLYTVNPDPQRPTCIWVNSDNGTHQIQDFDAYTGEACGEGTVRVLASQFVVPAPQCTPASYVSLQVLKPERKTYTTGSIAFDDGDGNPILGLEERPLDETGTASLTGLELNTATGLPQFLFTLNGETGTVGSVEVKLTWEGNYDATCVGEGTTVTKPPTPTPPATPTTTTPTAKVTTAAPTPQAKSGVLAFGTAHLASNTQACIASSSYLASVSGKNIASVTFTLDGHKLKTLNKANAQGKFSLPIGVKPGKVEHVSIHVTFASGTTSNRSATITRRLARCAVVHHVTAPRFTG